VTKTDFLSWLEQFRRIDNIRTLVANKAWSEAELDQLKETLEAGGRLEMKNEYKRRMAWG